jgi:hypothetical protein
MFSPVFKECADYTANCAALYCQLRSTLPV